MSKPTAHERLRFARTIRELRERAGLGGVEAGSRAGMSQSKISKIETAQLLPSTEDVRALCSAYGASRDERDDLVRQVSALRDESRRSRIVLAAGAPQVQRRIARMEASATSIRSFQPTLVIGLLQTAAYMSCVFGAELDGRSELSRNDQEMATKARAQRQSVLDDQSKEFALVMTEGALRWQAKDPTVMADQIDAISEATRRPNVRIGIIPWTTPVDVFPRHGFHLYDSVAVVGLETGSATITAPDDVELYERILARLEELASFDDPARRELARIAHDYRLIASRV